MSPINTLLVWVNIVAANLKQHRALGFIGPITVSPEHSTADRAICLGCRQILCVSRGEFQTYSQSGIAFQLQSHRPVHGWSAQDSVIDYRWQRPESIQRSGAPGQGVLRSTHVIQTVFRFMCYWVGLVFSWH